MANGIYIFLKIDNIEKLCVTTSYTTTFLSSMFLFMLFHFQVLFSKQKTVRRLILIPNCCVCQHRILDVKMLCR